MNTCVRCNRKYKYSRKQGHTLTRCNSCLVNERRFALKEKIIEYLGGECLRCGYKKSKRALDAHHLNPEEKLFNLSGAHARSWENIKKELDKCILLCANCHREEEESRTAAGR